jgi:glycosyltransferase 2 family protein
LPESSSSKKKHLSLLIRVLIGVGILYFVFRGQDWGKLRSLFFGLNKLVFVLATAIFVVCQFIVSLRWWLLLRTQSVHIGLWASVRLNFLGLFYNNFLPSSVGGDLVRAWYVTKHTHRRFEAALSVLVDRIIGLIVIAIMAFLAWWLLFDLKTLDMGQTTVFRVLGRHTRELLWGCAIAAAAVVFMLALPAVRHKLAGLAQKVSAYAMKALRKGYDAAWLYLKHPWTLLATVGVTFISQGIVVVGFWLIGRDMGIEATLRYYLVFFPLSWVLGALPISVAGAGVVEGWLVILFISNVAGVSREAATALALCQRAVWMLVSLPGLVIYMTGGHLPSEFFVDYEKSLN